LFTIYLLFIVVLIFINVYVRIGLIETTDYIYTLCVFVLPTILYCEIYAAAINYLHPSRLLKFLLGTCMINAFQEQT